MIRDLRTLLPYVRKYIWSYSLGLFFLLLTNAGQLYLPQLIRQAIDTVSLGDFAMSSILRIVLRMAAVAAMVGAGRFGWRFFLHGSSRRIEQELRGALYGHMQTLSSSFYGRYKTGDLMARFINDMNAIRMALGMGLVTFIDGLFMTLAILVILISQNARLTLLSIAPLPIITLGVTFFGRVIRDRFRRVQEGFSSISEMVQESLSGIRVVKTFAREKDFVQRFDRGNAEYSKRNLDLVRLWGILYPMVGFLGGLTTLILLYAGGAAVIEGRLSPGEFTAFFSYLQMLIWPMIGAGFTINILQRAAASLSRINAILEEKPDIASPARPVRQAIRGAISIRNLHYSYPDDPTPALSGISLEIPEGGSLGILGRTGSGKSTLVRLIPRLLDPPEGTIFIDGQEVRSYDLQQLRAAIGMVPQDPFLFSASIRENIAFGSRNGDHGIVQRAAGISTISRDLDTFPAGWETIVGERGITLSGGQKQRVTLSRAIAAEPAILILDDALSSVDTETEEQILGDLADFARGRTLIIISHRISTLQMADQIIVLEGGRITQRGTHARLIAEPGLYADIYRLQQLEEAYRKS